MGYRTLAILLVLLGFTTVLAQQAPCSDTVQQALSRVQAGCADTGRNQACYGYVSLQATPRDGVTDFQFTKAGDLANTADLQTLQLSAFDAAANTWGIALMKLQANLPDTLPGQNVTFVMFGDVNLQNAVAPSPTLPTLEVTSPIGATIHSGPANDYRAVGSLSAGSTTTADGRNDDGSWIRIRIPDSSSLGWVQANLLQSTDDLSGLDVVAADVSETSYTPMQAFYFSTGITQTTCAAAPPDGILVQTPAGVGKIDLRANDVDIQLGSTAFLQAQPGGVLTISVIEGQGTVTADGKTVTVPAGSQATVPIDANLQVAGRPNQPQPYDPSLVQSLPIQLLPITITIAPPATQDQILAANLPTGSVPGVNVLGLAIDLNSLIGLTEDLFCPQMDIVLAQAGMSRQQYLDLLNHSLTTITTTDGQQQITDVIQKLTACP